jgi:hypothetical protein
MKKYVFLTVMAVFFASFLGSTEAQAGSSTLKLSVSPTIPAAEGTIKIKKMSDGNTSVYVLVKHMAAPEKLTPPAVTYVVWIRANKDAEPQNVGMLSVDKNLNGELETTTPLNSFDLMITGEISGQVQKPSGQPLLWTSFSS